MNISYPTPVGLWVTMCIHCCLAQAYSGTAIQTVTDYLSVSEWTVKEIASHLRGVTLADYLVPDECTSLSSPETYVCHEMVFLRCSWDSP